MRLNTGAFATAVAAVAATLFTICAFFVALAPAATLAVFSYALHIDLTGLTRPISWLSFGAGLFAVTATAGIAAAAVAAIYNRQIEHEKPQETAVRAALQAR